MAIGSCARPECEHPYGYHDMDTGRCQMPDCDCREFVFGAQPEEAIENDDTPEMPLGGASTYSKED